MIGESANYGQRASTCGLTACGPATLSQRILACQILYLTDKYDALHSLPAERGLLRRHSDARASRREARVTRSEARSRIYITK
jgi:hypothetical protein